MKKTILSAVGLLGCFSCHESSGQTLPRYHCPNNSNAFPMRHRWKLGRISLGFDKWHSCHLNVNPDAKPG